MNAATPLRDHAVRFVVAEDAALPPLMLWRPPQQPASARLPLALCVHGHSRQPLEQLRAFMPVAAQHGFALALPLFDERHHRCYQQLLHPRRGTRSDLALLQALEAAAPAHALATDRLHLFGYSGGAQFVHRFAMRHPERTAALAVAAAGWYTWPDPATPWPLGTADAQHRLGRALDLDAFLRLPMALWVGEHDTLADEQVREHPALLQQQGPHRVERAQRWAEAVRSAAHRRGITQALPLHLVPRAGHDFVSCHRRGNLADRVMAFFASTLPTSTPAVASVDPADATLHLHASAAG